MRLGVYASRSGKLGTKMVDFMSIKDAIHQLVDEMPEEDADLVLGYLRSLAGSETTATRVPGELRMSDAERALLERAKPLTLDDPLWGLIGVIDDDGPDDRAANHDKYLADYYSDFHRDE